MSEKELKDQPVGAGDDAAEKPAAAPSGKAETKSKEERLAEALRANLRRRKAAAKSRKDG